VSGAIAMVLKNWTDCLCQVISGRTHIRIRSQGEQPLVFGCMQVREVGSDLNYVNRFGPACRLAKSKVKTK